MLTKVQTISKLRDKVRAQAIILNALADHRTYQDFEQFQSYDGTINVYRYEDALLVTSYDRYSQTFERDIYTLKSAQELLDTGYGNYELEEGGNKGPQLRRAFERLIARY